MNNDEQLDPEINPAKGVKRLNKIPMFLFISLAVFAALVIMFGIISHNEKKRGKGKEKGISMDDASVEQISSQIPEGDIKPTTEVIYRDGADAPAVERPAAVDNEALTALAARLEALEASNAAQAEELRQAKEAEKLAVANAPLVVDIGDFRSRYAGVGANAGGENPTQFDVAMGREPLAGAGTTLLPRLEDQEGAGIEALTMDDLEGANAAENAYRKRNEDGTVLVPYKVQERVSDLELKAGSTIPITMISGINSDLPGDIVAQVNANVFDTRLGDYTLIPMGTRLIGTYVDDNVMGVDRVGIIWNRLIYPNGESLSIESMRGSDTEGYAGLKDKVNNHYWRIFGSALLLSGVSASVAIVGDDEGSGSNGQFGGQRTAQQTAKEEVALNLGRVITEKLRQDINIEPTIEIRPGMKSIVLVTKDLTFEKPYEQHLDYEKLGHPDFSKQPLYYDPRKGKEITVIQSSK